MTGRYETTLPCTSQFPLTLPSETLRGNAGADAIWGGDGVDTFEFTEVADAGDIIFDFDAETELLDLSALFDELGTASNAATRSALVDISQAEPGLYQVSLDADANGSFETDLVTILTPNVSDTFNTDDFIFV